MEIIRKNDIILIAAAAIIAAVIFIGGAAGRAHGGIPELEITVNGKVYGTYPLDKDQKIDINGTNKCEIKDGSVRMTGSTCHNKICVHSKAIDKNGGSIVCLPNRVVLKITGTETKYDSIAE